MSLRRKNRVKLDACFHFAVPLYRPSFKRPPESILVRLVMPATLLCDTGWQDSYWNHLATSSGPAPTYLPVHPERKAIKRNRTGVAVENHFSRPRL